LSSAQNLLPLLYAIDEEYGWSQGMRAINHALLASHIGPGATILEIGCGSGQFLAELAQRQPLAQVVGLDLNGQALRHAQQRAVTNSALMQANLLALPIADQSIDLVTAFDVYDQAAVALVAALAESRRILRSTGLLLLRVSAYPWLEGAHDRAFNTGQRYQAQEVVTALRAVGFTILRVTYANTLFAPLVIPLRLGQRWGLVGLTPQLYTDTGANRALAAALDWEAQWLHHHNLPFGISLYVLARKSA